MAAKRISSSAINWAAFAERVPKSDLSQFQALKAKNDVYIRRIVANPDTLPKIDWSFYKSKISVPGMVDNFQKSYEGLQIPYPSDKGLIAKINEQENEMKKSFTQCSAKVEKQIEELQARLAELEAQIPFSEMTIEEYYIINPEVAVDPEKPTFFPHDEQAREATRQAIEEDLNKSKAQH